MSVGSARVCVVDELVERVDDQDRVLGMVVSQPAAIREGWLHRVAVTVCRDERGRFLVHRPTVRQVSRFPGLYEVEVGGAANVGESYEQAAARELAEELSIRALPHLLFTFINRSGLSPHWLGVHEAVVPDAVVPDPDEVAWHGWLTEPELRSALLEWRFTPTATKPSVGIWRSGPRDPDLAHHAQAQRLSIALVRTLAWASSSGLRAP